MNRFFIRLAVLTLLPLHAAAAGALRAEATLADLPVTLRASAVVKDASIRLSDLFSGVDAEKDSRVVAKAPAAGKDVVLTAKWLEKVAKSNGLDWKADSAETTITVTRAARNIDKDEIYPLVLKELAQAGAPERADVALFGDFPLKIPTGKAYEIGFEETALRAGGKTFRTKAVIRTDDETLTFALSGQIKPFALFPTAADRMTAGQILTESDIVMKKLPLDKMKRKTASLSTADLVGKEVRRTIDAGKIITADDIRSRIMVAKGKLITLSFRKGGILLSAQGKALENGGLGDTVRVMNTQSKSVVQGTVTGPETVVVDAVDTHGK